MSQSYVNIDSGTLRRVVGELGPVYVDKNGNVPIEQEAVDRHAARRVNMHKLQLEERAKMRGQFQNAAEAEVIKLREKMQAYEKKLESMGSNLASSFDNRERVDEMYKLVQERDEVMEAGLDKVKRLRADLLDQGAKLDIDDMMMPYIQSRRGYRWNDALRKYDAETAERKAQQDAVVDAQTMAQDSMAASAAFTTKLTEALSPDEWRWAQDKALQAFVKSQFDRVLFLGRHSAGTVLVLAKKPNVALQAMQATLEDRAALNAKEVDFHIQNKDIEGTEVSVADGDDDSGNPVTDVPAAPEEDNPQDTDMAATVVEEGETGGAPGGSDEAQAPDIVVEAADDVGDAAASDDLIQRARSNLNRAMRGTGEMDGELFTQALERMLERDIGRLPPRVQAWARDGYAEMVDYIRSSGDSELKKTVRQVIGPPHASARTRLKKLYRVIGAVPAGRRRKKRRTQ